MIRPARPEEMDEVRALFAEYQRHIGVDLCFQGFAEELRGLPGKYVEILLDVEPEGIAGVVALRPAGADRGEMKRLFVRPAFHGQGRGRRLAEAMIAAARARGYTMLVLDTLPTMPAAIALYRALGFAEIPPYTENPVAGALFLGLPLG